MEPRAYSPAPVGTNFLGLGYGYTSGDVLLDPSSPLTDVEARIHALAPGYARTFALFARTCNFGAVIPYVDGNVKGKVSDVAGEVTRYGFGDARFRFSTHLLGGEALTKAEFAEKKPDTVIGTSLSIVAPTGQYASRRLINIGSNRWAFKPEIGVSHQIGDWFADGSAGLWIFGDNPAYYTGVRRSQDPLAVFQAHGGYLFMPGLWLAADIAYYTGGKTTVGDKTNDDLQSNSRYGLTLSVPLSQSMAIKIAGSKGLATRVGGDFTTVAAALQYRWFDLER